jgi:prolyl oligopeptidase
MPPPAAFVATADARDRAHTAAQHPRQEVGLDPADLDALLSYSPYHNVSAPFSHTATLLITGDNDSRVDPLHSRKMTAQLQQATVDAPVLHHLLDGAGHTGVAGDEGIRVAAKILAFIAHHTGLVPAGGT